ncbi:MAG: aldo/keto reductase [Phycisphaerales bacterium]|nr:MAG: aldo/keto reductase [Phycisphaerales bacterium]
MKRRQAYSQTSTPDASSYSRRAFLQKTALTGAGLAMGVAGSHAASAGSDLPRRVLGRTGARVTILGLGTAPIGEARGDIDEAAKIFAEVIDRGVNYVDTARIYGIAEEALGQILPTRRDRVFLVTKCWTDSGARAQESFETSLRTLKTDHVDLVHIHHVGGKDIEKVLAKDGILEYLLKQKEAGKTRFIGISGHARPPRFVQMLETDQIDVVMPVMNYADRNIYDFESKVLPECRKRNVGVVAMKVYAGIKGGFPNHRRGWVGCSTPAAMLSQALAYALDLDGVSVANVGPFTMEQAIQNVELARQYKPLTDSQREELLAFGEELAPTLGPRYGPVA